MVFAKPPRVSSLLMQEIQDAVLLGGATEIDAILDALEGDEDFPQTLRHDLEAMRYFRSFYGKGGELEPSRTDDKRRAADLESFWGREIIEGLGFYADFTREKNVRK